MEKDKKTIVRVRGVILDENKLLVVKHAHDTSFAALPGGHLEWNEDIKECLSREIVEELGVVPQIDRLLYINNFTDANNIQSIEFFFEILNTKDYKNTTNKTRTHAHEISEICWINPDDTISLLPKGFFEDFKNGKIFSNEVRYLHP
ncbi:MAG: NUDIX domain-containing protein [Candidatus Parcubacteria bacterium]|nr:NUDIX domain-containing protein [Candidatus Parcubacteria bacterium]